MYKLIAMDMDGTLLTNSKEISERSKIAIERANKRGIKVVVCTGRLFASAKIFAKLLGVKTPVIASNGAYIRDKETDEAIYQKYLNSDEILKIVKLTKEYGFYPQLFTPDEIYSEKLVSSSERYNLWNMKLKEEDRVRIKIVKSLEEIIEKGNITFLKIVVMSDNIEKLYELKEKIKRMENLSVVSSVPMNFEVMAKGISKGCAVEKLVRYYGISPEEVICIGDSENDLSMIKYAGLGVAMGNAIDEVKKASDYITDTNENDGVAKVIEKFILD